MTIRKGHHKPVCYCHCVFFHRCIALTPRFSGAERSERAGAGRRLRPLEPVVYFFILCRHLHRRTLTYVAPS